MNPEIAGKVMRAVTTVDDSYYELGVSIGKLYTNHGLPIDMALERVDASDDEKLVVLYGAQNWLIEHRRNSNATDKAIDRQRRTNYEIMQSYINTGETGIY